MIPPRRILLIRPSALGDVCRSVPVLVSLKAAFPEADVDWLVQDSFVDAIRHHPDLAEAVGFPRRRLGRLVRRGRIDRVLAFAGELRRRDYDLVVDAQGLLRSGLIARATGARRRIGFANAREGAARFYSEKHAVERSVHTVDRMLGLIAAAGVRPVRDMRLYSARADRDAASRLLAGGGGGGLSVLAPTSRWPAKRWPIERFAAVAEGLLAAEPGPIVVVGSPGERGQVAPLLERFKGEPRVMDLVGRTSIGVLMAVIERARRVIANDSAALHVAVGFDRPAIGLFGPTDAARVGPYRRPGDVIQHVGPGDILDHKRASGVRLMERIGVEEVLARALASSEASPAAVPGRRA